MRGSQQRYILCLCLALSPLSAAKCQCQSNLCSAGNSPSAARLRTPRHYSHLRVSKHLPGTHRRKYRHSCVCTPSCALTHCVESSLIVVGYKQAHRFFHPPKKIILNFFFLGSRGQFPTCSGRSHPEGKNGNIHKMIQPSNKHSPASPSQPELVTLP